MVGRLGLSTLASNPNHIYMNRKEVFFTAVLFLAVACNKKDTTVTSDQSATQSSSKEK